MGAYKYASIYCVSGLFGFFVRGLSRFLGHLATLVLWCNRLKKIEFIPDTNVFPVDQLAQYFFA
jgi:hypothetical protein